MLNESTKNFIEKLAKKLSGLGTHDWFINEIREVLDEYGWKDIEMHCGSEKGPDILATSPNGKTVAWEVEIEHASGKKSAQRHLQRYKEIQRDGRKIEKIIFVGGQKHESKFKEVCKEEHSNFESDSIQLEDFTRIDKEKMKDALKEIGLWED